MNRKIRYIFNRTLNEIFISLIQLIDFLLIDLTIFSPIRTFIWRFVITIGKGTRVRKGLFITNIWKLKIGDNCFVNRENLFDNNALITIGNNCSIGYRNQFLTTNHYEKQNIKNKLDFTTYSEKILIGNNVWITSGCTLLPGTKIEDNVILAANSVAKGVLEKGWIYGGTPAKKIRQTDGFICKNI